MSGIGKIILIISQDGVGKTRGAMGFPEEILFLDTDNKAQNTYDGIFQDRLIDIKTCLQFYKKSDPSKSVLRGQMDIDATMASLNENIAYALDNMEKYETIVIDGISDLKRIASAYWLLHDPKHRKSIGENNIAARAEINETVRDNMLFPLINTARMLDKTLVITSKMSDQYILLEGDDGKMHNTKTGNKVCDCPEWSTYKADIKLTLTKDGSKFFMLYDRAPVEELPPKENITGKHIYNILKDRNMV